MIHHDTLRRLLRQMRPPRAGEEQGRRAADTGLAHLALATHQEEQGELGSAGGELGGAGCELGGVGGKLRGARGELGCVGGELGVVEGELGGVGGELGGISLLIVA